MEGDLTVLQSVLVFVGIPAAVFVLLMLAVLAPGWTRAGRYRPGESWNHEPLLINPQVTGDVRHALTATAATDSSPGQDETLGLGREGGASARW